MYFDHAATTPLDKEVLEKMYPYLSEIYGNPDSVHAYGRLATAGVDMARDKIAAVSHCRADEIYFTSCGSESNSWAIKSTMVRAGKNKRLIVSAAEHHSVLNCAKQLKEEGYPVTFLTVNKYGTVDLSELKSELTPDVALVVIMAANNEVGSLNDIPSLYEAAENNGSLFFTDCVQTAGNRELPVKHADMLSFSAHKFYGPKGVGGLFIKKGTQLCPLINGGEQERGLRGGTTNTAGVVGMAYALEKAQKNMDENRTYVKKLRDSFEENITAEIPDIRINGNRKNRLEGISNVTFFGVDGTALLIRLDLAGIAASLGSACASGSLSASHVLKAMGIGEKEAFSSLRFSFGKDNTVEEVNLAADKLKELIKQLR